MDYQLPCPCPHFTQAEVEFVHQPSTYLNECCLYIIQSLILQFKKC